MPDIITQDEMAPANGAGQRPMRYWHNHEIAA